MSIVIPIADRHLPYAETAAARLREGGLRVEVDARREKMQAKIRDAQLEKVPYMLVVGDREAAEGTAALRLRSGQDLGPVAIERIADRAGQLVAARSGEL